MHVYHGYGAGIDRDILAEQDVVFTTYETIASDVNQSHKLHEITWFRVILDEGEKCPLPSNLEFVTDLCVITPVSALYQESDPSFRSSYKSQEQEQVVQ